MATRWLKKGDVCAALGVSEATLDRMIGRGEFPHAVAFPGEHRSRWRAVDVRWYFLGREIADRLFPDPTPPAEEGDPAAPRHPASPGRK